MNRMSLQTAAEILDVSDSLFYTSDKYKPFLIKQKGIKENLFNYKAFMEEQGRQSKIRSSVSLFVEYLNKELDYSYMDIAKFIESHSAKVDSRSLSQRLWKDDYGFKIALQIGMTYKRFAPELINQFDEYYGDKPFLTIKRLPKWSAF
jgi:hypothetical protein